MHLHFKFKFLKFFSSNMNQICYRLFLLIKLTSNVHSKFRNSYTSGEVLPPSVFWIIAAKCIVR